MGAMISRSNSIFDVFAWGVLSLGVGITSLSMNSEAYKGMQV